jgi:hypothetical protein
MNEVKLSRWFKMMNETELLNADDCIDNEVDKKRFVEFNNEFWKLKCEDRNIVLDDLKADEGILYKTMIAWNESELITELDLGMSWYEYSIEDYFRDTFGIIKNESKFNVNDIFNIFELRDVNMMMYGDEYNDDDYDYEG